MIEIDSGEFTDGERADACNWMADAGHSPRHVRGKFLAGPALPGSFRLDFERYRMDENGKMIINKYANVPESDSFTIYASTRLGWLVRYLTRTGRAIDE